MYSIKENIEELSLIDTYKNRIKELNDIVGNLDKENYNLKKTIEAISNQSIDYIKMCICKYTPYMVRNVVYNMFNIKITSKFITQTASENNFFEHDFLALRIPRKENSSEKYASTVIFSEIGVYCLINILIKKCVINHEIKKDSLDISFNNLKEGKVKEYTMTELRNME